MSKPPARLLRCSCPPSFPAFLRPRQFHHFPLLRHRPSPVNYLGKRFTSTSQAAAVEAGSLVTRIKNLVFGTSVGLFVWFGYLYVTDVRAGIHQWAIAPSLRWIYDDAEEAHEAGTESLKGLYAWGLHPRERGNVDEKGDLSIEVEISLFHFNQYIVNRTQFADRPSRSSAMSSPIQLLPPPV